MTSKRKHNRIDPGNRHIPNAIYSLVLVALLFFSKEGLGQIAMEYLDPAQTGVSFINRIEEMPGRTVGNYDYFYNGGGVAIADFNADGLPDLFFTGNDAPNELYLNQGNFVFHKAGPEAGIASDKWCTGVTVADVNQDGWLDIYVSCSGPDFKIKSTANELYLNQGDGTFVESATEYGIADNGLSTQSVFFDMDNDGDLDLWVLNHAVRNLANDTQDWIATVRNLPEEVRRRFCNSLYRNDDGKFVDITEAAGILAPGFGLGIAVSDFDGDSWPDVYICNDYFIPDQLFINDGKGGFTDAIHDKLGHSSFYSMGVDAADVNNDGWMDLMVPDMTPSDHYRSKMMMSSMNVPEFRFLTLGMKFLPQYMFNTLQINVGEGKMMEIAQAAGVHQSDWSWAPLLADFDNDGNRDLFITNGIRRDVMNNDWRLGLMELIRSQQLDPQTYFDYLQTAPQTPLPNPLFRNLGGMKFGNVTEDCGLNRTSFSNGAAYGDLDGDGDLDLVVNNLDSEAFIIQNNAGGNSLRIKLSSDTPGLLADGSIVRVFSAGQSFTAEYQFCRGYQSYVEPVLHFGLAGNSEVDSVIVGWNNGMISKILNPSIKEFLSIKYEDQNKEEGWNGALTYSTSHKLFQHAPQRLKPFYFHKENDFDDFEKEVLLPHRMSSLGPALAVGDVNSDGKDDFLIGGSKGNRSALFIQYEEGYFRQTALPDEQIRVSEVLGACFFDADGDGDEDLYLAHGGGGDFSDAPQFLQDVLLINESGEWQIQSSRLPAMLTSTKVVRPYDVDSDGDLDLFVGGRTVPGRYPESPRSYLLMNNKGVFIESSDWQNDHPHIGMITDAVWHDWDGDGTKDLVAVGEWTGIQVFLNVKGRLKRISAEITDQYRGWWWSLKTADLDSDGDDDLILGNLGLNNKFKPSAEKPLHIFANDFDENGSLDIVLSKYYKNELVPVRGRECSSMQMPFIVDEFPSYDAFASSPLSEIYKQDKLEEAIHYSVNDFASRVLMNEGKGRYRAIELPFEAQLFPIQGMVARDLNWDGKVDLLLAGNYIQTEVETIPYDAGKGLFLIGNGDGTFSSAGTYDRTGLALEGDVRGFEMLHSGNPEKVFFVMARNGQRIQIWEMTED